MKDNITQDIVCDIVGVYLTHFIWDNVRIGAVDLGYFTGKQWWLSYCYMPC